MADGEDVQRLWWVQGWEAHGLQAAGEDGLGHWGGRHGSSAELLRPEGCERGRLERSSDFARAGRRTGPRAAAVRPDKDLLWMPGGVFQGARHCRMVEEDGRELSVVG